MNPSDASPRPAARAARLRARPAALRPQLGASLAASLAVHAGLFAAAAWLGPALAGGPQGSAGARAGAPRALLAFAPRAELAPRVLEPELAPEAEPLALPAFEFPEPDFAEPDFAPSAEPRFDPAPARPSLPAHFADRWRAAARPAPRVAEPSAELGAAAPERPAEPAPPADSAAERSVPAELAAAELAGARGLGERAARPAHCPKPAYPRASLRRGEEGTVRCRLHVGASGAVLRVELVGSSGFARLDRAALEALAEWTFEPALALGAPRASAFLHDVEFVIEPSAR